MREAGFCLFTIFIYNCRRDTVCTESKDIYNKVSFSTLWTAASPAFCFSGHANFNLAKCDRVSANVSLLNCVSSFTKPTRIFTFIYKRKAVKVALDSFKH